MWGGGGGGHQVGRGRHTVPCHRAVTVNGADMGDMLIHLASNSARRRLRSSVSVQKKYTHIHIHTHIHAHTQSHIHVHGHTHTHTLWTGCQSVKGHTFTPIKGGNRSCQRSPHGMRRTFKAPEPGFKPSSSSRRSNGSYGGGGEM